MARVVIFGLQDFASLARFYLDRDSPHQVVAFCVHRAYLPADGAFEGLPVIAFEDVQDQFPSGEFSFFAPMSPAKMNKRRAEVYGQIKAKGYPLISYISSKATVWMPERIGENCFILEDNTVQPYTSIGNNVVLWSGNHIGHHSTIGDHVTFTSHVVLSGHCTVDPYCFFGVNATIRDQVRIGEGTLVAMAAAIVRDTEAWSVYKGNPARKSEVSSTDVDI